MNKQALLILPWLLAGGLAIVAIWLNMQNGNLREDINNLNDFRLRYEQQVDLGNQQRQVFEGQIQQLQVNLRAAQSQMTNLSGALQEAREMMEPAARSGNQGSLQ